MTQAKRAKNMGEESYFIGVDVGTGSARAGLFDRGGKLLSSAKRDIEIYRMPGAIVEQSSDNIWSCVCAAVRECIEASGLSSLSVKGIGFDATCSLVVLDKDDQPITVSPSGEMSQNIIVWMDHRAIDQANRINQTGHRVLDYVGGKISPEMETPKLLWLKENLPDTFHNAGRFFDLTDFLTWRATGDLSRSVCTVTCKWTYMAHEKSWDSTYFEAIGLSEVSNEDYVRIGQSIVDAGTPLGSGLTLEAATELGLETGTAVAAGLIDAHAGGLGTVGADGPHAGAEARMAYVFGTSACTMSSSAAEAFVPGVWGPYYSAMVPGLWLSEGGQSAAGEAIAHLLSMHPAYNSVKDTASMAGLSVPDYLLTKIEEKGGSASEAVAFAKQIIVVPEFLGNRAPFADPDARAVISGLDLDTDLDSLIGLYVAGLTGLGYGLKQILRAQAENGVNPEIVVISGGAGDSPVVKQLLADSAGIAIAEPGTKEPVLLGSAMLGAVAAREFENMTETMGAMSTLGNVFSPVSTELAKTHEIRFKAFEALQAAARIVRSGS
jgi:D-ribulokinase